MRRFVAVLMCVLLLAGSLSVPCLDPIHAAPANEIRIAGQFGLVYAPILVAQAHKICDNYGLMPVWKEYVSGAAVREGLISGVVDLVFMGLHPFLLGWDKGCPWKAAIGFVVIPVGLVTYDPSIKSLKDF